LSTLSAAEEVLLAAVRLAKRVSEQEFSEWDLTVETWNLNKNRWGLRGYESHYPDHKRVMNEIMAREGRGIVKRRWLERIRKNHYRVTPAGFAKAAFLESKKIDTRERTVAVYDAVKGFAFHRVFESHLKNPEEPRTWIGAAAFLSLSRNDPEILDKQMRAVNDGINIALSWMAQTGRDLFRRGDSGSAITKDRLLRLRDFVKVLQERFAPQFAAIESKAR